jgi:ATP-dependent DNA helicase RecG
MPADPIAPLLAPLESLPGIGPARAERLAALTGGTRVIDLLLHLPERYIDWRAELPLRALREGEPARAAGVIETIHPAAPPRRPLRFVIGDQTGFAEIVYFHPGPWLERFRPGLRVVVAGEVGRFAGRPAFVHPAYLLPAGQETRIPPLSPVWPLTEGLTAAELRRAVHAALARLAPLPEWLAPERLSRHHWPSFAEALQTLQAPAAPPPPEARQRLAYDELFAHQLRLVAARRARGARTGRRLTGDGELIRAALAAFGHALTPGQKRAWAEIEADLAASLSMHRLLQGDVGSGKTILALLAMLRAVEAGAQAALMAPTEILARQHFALFTRLSPVPVGLLTGTLREGERRAVLAGLAQGTLPLVIGTHALIEEEVRFHDLALAVIDEQHRFGVAQRQALAAKARDGMANLLVMSATPIPRSLLLTRLGALDVSRIPDKPPGRERVRTTVHAMSQLPQVIEALDRRLARGDRIYWICPLVAEQESRDLAAAEARFAALQTRFGAAVGLVHGRQEAEQRAATLAAFAAGRLRILVATTVIEVGVDVPEARVIVIEQAERFGLAQLHQLRGRVGRGRGESFCLLLYGEPLTEAALHRLSWLRETDDGFRIAEADFRWRGGGEVFGARQSGLPSYRLVRWPEDEALLRLARRDAEALLAADPELAASPRGRAARLLLRLLPPPEVEDPYAG